MLGGMWQGRRITNGYSEQIMSHAPVPKDQYAALAKRFNPEKWNPDGIVQLAKRAGMKFIVLTSKHHDGFNMFHTRLTDYNVVDATPYKRDIVKQLADGCRRHGMPFGVYYSSIDWHYPGATTTPSDDNNNLLPKVHEDFNAGQLTELMSNYGPLSEIWFDMGKPTPQQSKRFTDTVHSIQRQCMVSGRVFNYEGDFTVMGDNALPKHLIEEPWQTPASIYTDTWGYRSWAERNDLEGKIKEHILQLVQVVSRGGNYLLNIGPRGDGSVVEFEAQVLGGVGDWLKRNGEAIYGTEPQPFRDLNFGYATSKPGKLYLLVSEMPVDGRLRLPGLKNELKRAWLLADPARGPLKLDNTEAMKSVWAPSIHATPPVTVVVVEYSGKLLAVPPAQHAAGDGRFILKTKEADQFFNYNGEGYYEPPTVYKDQWSIAVDRPGKYQARVEFAKGSFSRRIDLVIGAQRLALTLDGTRGFAEAGPFDLPKTENMLARITPPEPFLKGEKIGVDIQRVVLTPRA